MNNEYDKVTCFPGNMIFDQSSNSQIFAVNHDMFDNNGSSCHWSKKFPYKVRFPWPTGISIKQDFIVKIYGENLKCFDYKYWNGKNGLIIYIPLDFQVKSQFNGNFMGCELRSSNETICNYKCSCQGELCQAYYIDLQDENESIKICEIEKII